jgi:hypothetical protein
MLMFILISITAFKTTSMASVYTHTLRTDSIKYNTKSGAYVLTLMELDCSRTGSLASWSVIFQKCKENKKITQILRRKVCEKLVEVKFDNRNTKNILDDKVLTWKIIYR